MTTKFKFAFIFFCTISMLSYAQTKDNLVGYLTRANLEIETKVLTDYCNCTDKKQFIEAYQDVAVAFNSMINTHLANLSQLRTRDALNEFKRINSANFVENDNALQKANSELEKFKKLNCNNQKAFWPAAITIAEITGIGNAIVGLINEGKKRRDTQRDKLIGILETFKVPSIQNYKCDKESKPE